MFPGDLARLPRPRKAYSWKISLPFLALVIFLCLPAWRAWAPSKVHPQCESELRVGPRESQVAREPRAGAPATAEAEERSAEVAQARQARLSKAKGTLERLPDPQDEDSSGYGPGEEREASESAAPPGREAEAAWNAARDDYMKSALHGDALALRATLANFNATLAADWAAELAAQPQRGILMLAGPRDGHVYTINAFVTLWVIRRHFKSKLPVVIMYWGETESIDPAAQEFFRAELGAPAVEFVDASRLPWPAHHRRLFLPNQTYEKPGWAIKLAATYFAPFQEVLYLDTDSTPLAPPESLFELPDYRRSGSAFWTGVRHGRSPMFNDLIEMGLIDAAVAPPDMRQTESGQWLLDKRRHREAFEYMLFLGTRSEYIFPRSFGDKEVYLAGFALAGAAADYRLVRDTLGLAWGPLEGGSSGQRRSRGLIQYSPVDGRPLFHHKYLKTKYALGEPQGRRVDVMSAPVTPESALKLSGVWRKKADFWVVNQKTCPHSLDEGFDVVAARCGQDYGGQKGRRIQAFAVAAGSEVAAALDAQEAGWKRLLAAREENPELFPMRDVLGFLGRWGKRR